MAGLIDLPDLQAVVRDPLAGTCLGGSTPAGVSWHQLELIAVDLRSQCLDLVTPEFEYSRLVAGLLDITTSEFDFVQQVLCIGHPAIVAGRRSAA